MSLTFSYLLVDYPRSRIDKCCGRIARPNGRVIYKIYRARAGHTLRIRDCKTLCLITTIHRKKKILYTIGNLFGLSKGNHRYYFTDDQRQTMAKSGMHLDADGVQLHLKIRKAVKQEAVLGGMLFLIIDEIYKHLGDVIKKALVLND